MKFFEIIFTKKYLLENLDISILFIAAKKMLIKLFLLERGRVAKYVLTVVIIEDQRILKYKLFIGKAHKNYYHYYYKYFTKEKADKERFIFKKKNRPYFGRQYVFNKIFWKRYLLWNKGTLDECIYDIFLRFNIRISKL